MADTWRLLIPRKKEKERVESQEKASRISKRNLKKAARHCMNDGNDDDDDDDDDHDDDHDHDGNESFVRRASSSSSSSTFC